MINVTSKNASARPRFAISFENAMVHSFIADRVRKYFALQSFSLLPSCRLAARGDQ
jgi:hypothetical protein